MFNDGWMQQAITLAQQAATQGEVPVGAMIVHQGKMIAEAHNQVEALRDPTAHAEMLAIRAACQHRGSKFLDECTLVVTLEPCAMCAQAMAHARIPTLIYGASDPKSGGVEHGARVFQHSTTHWQPEIISGIRETECSALLRGFFEGLR